jgi:hypothetical protein
MIIIMELWRVMVGKGKEGGKAVVVVVPWLFTDRPGFVTQNDQLHYRPTGHCTVLIGSSSSALAIHISGVYSSWALQSRIPLGVIMR